MKSTHSWKTTYNVQKVIEKAELIVGIAQSNCGTQDYFIAGIFLKIFFKEIHKASSNRKITFSTQIYFHDHVFHLIEITGIVRRINFVIFIQVAKKYSLKVM